MNRWVGIFLGFVLLFPQCGTAAEPSPSNLYRASNQGAIGETSNLYLIPNGYYVDIGTNDVTGGTDKLLTASIKAGMLRQYSQSSFELTAFWRLLTPTYKTKFRTPDLSRPVGRFADWAQIKGSYATIKSFANQTVKLQSSLGVNHVGAKGGPRLHRWIHEKTNNRVDQLEYIDQPVGLFADGGALVAWISDEKPLGRASHQTQVALAVEHGRFMVEAGVSVASVLVVRPSWWELAAEAKVVRQLHSEVYHDDIREFRYEAAAGTRLFHYFKPTVKYLSPYLKGDPVGQTYFDFLNVIVPM